MKKKLIILSVVLVALLASYKIGVANGADLAFSNCRIFTYAVDHDSSVRFDFRFLYNGREYSHVMSMAKTIYER